VTTTPKLRGLLVRIEGGGLGIAESALAAASVPLRAAGFDALEPLFAVPAEAAAAGPALEAGPGAVFAAAQWFRAPLAARSAPSPWDAAHEAVAAASLEGALGAAPGAVYVEPDFEQAFLTVPPGPAAEALAARAGNGVVDPPDRDLPHRDAVAWHLADDFSGLRAARAAVADPGAGKRVRVAHLDTGFDALHEARPARLQAALQRNFVDGEPPGDARDPGPGAGGALLDNPGHGTGTLGILAGGVVAALGEALGGAPDVEVMPLRIAKSVILIRTSALAAALDYASAGGPGGARLADVVSLSMGGVASRAWADAVNKAYEAGVFMVAAAGNNLSTGIFGVPTRFVVYPARFRRVVAACGVMADGRPYYGLPAGKLQGNWGPASKMATALAAFTPNMPWAELGAAVIVDRDGGGTSSATPQIAAAAALWLTRHADRVAAYAEPWQRVEAVRHALFTSAHRLPDATAMEKLGNGVLSARRALDVAPPASLVRTPRDTASFAFVRLLTGLGLAAADSGRADSGRGAMLALEATQLAGMAVEAGDPSPLEEALADPDLPATAIGADAERRFLAALLDHPRVSRTLRRHLDDTYRERHGRRASRPGRARRAVAEGKRGAARRKTAKPLATPPPPAASYALEPPHRHLRGYALEPSLAVRLTTAPISQVTFTVPWEPLQPGPVGEYLEVIDFDPAARCFYEPVDLDDPKLLAQDGLAPSEGTPQFHQQMVYAVAALTIRNFERALGRRVLWAPGPPPPGANAKNDSHYVQRLRIYPHALRGANAYYSPARKALLFGYYPASDDCPGEHLPGGTVFTCLSHDVVAHETTHALLDGMHRRFTRPSNLDVLAFHEAFADLVALFQHFTFPEILRHQIARTRGELRSHQNLLGELAGEFGRTSGLRGALRSAIGARNPQENDRWEPYQPNAEEYARTLSPHKRGAILVAAVFDAFLAIYEKRAAGLLRLATNGSGVLGPGAIPPDLVERLAEAARKSASHVLAMCVRALDYCPPVDITFGEFLRAVITADRDLVRDDDLGYRVAFVEAFRRRGIYPRDLRTLSVESLCWRGPRDDEHRASSQLLAGLALLRDFAHQHVHTTDRRGLFELSRGMRRTMHGWLREHFASGEAGPRDAAFLGIDPGRPFEVHALRVANRVGPDGDLLRQLVLSLLQERTVSLLANDRRGPQMVVEGGCTILADLQRLQVDYCIRKNVDSSSRVERQRDFAARQGTTALYETYFGTASEREPVARLHRGE
jgi:hypothetical protein